MRSSVETKADFGNDGSAKGKRWLAELKLYSRETEKWRERGEKIVKRYRDEREQIKADGARRKLALLWSNVQTMAPALLARVPSPSVSRRFKDNDPVARVASEVAERVLSYLVTKDGRFFGCAKSARDDYLLPGLGVVRQVYRPTFNTIPAAPETTPLAPTPPDAGAAGLPVPASGTGDNTYREIATEEIEDHYVHWKDFFRTPGARTWEEVSAVGFRAYMTRDELMTRFGAEIGAKVPLDFVPERLSKEDASYDLFKKAGVWEIWDRAESEVIWVCPGHEDVLDSKPDPLKLNEFFPCPRPLMATTTTDSLVPVPDYCQYQDQAEEVDELTGRIANVVKAIKARGLYAGQIKDQLEKLFSDSNELDLIPVDDIAALQQMGGLDRAVYFAPIDMMIKVVEGLYAARDKAKQDAFEITGLADILRGKVDPREKAAQSEIKERWGSMRVRQRQSDVAGFLRDLLCIKFEIAFSQFQERTLLAIANVESFPQEDQPFVAPALAMLRDRGRRYFEIDVETDSTIQPNEAIEQRQRTEFLGSVGTFLANAMPVLQMAPQLAPMMGEMLLFGVRGFRIANTLEGAIERGMQAIAQMGAQMGSQAQPQGAPAGAIQAQGHQIVAQAKMQQIASNERMHAADAALEKRAQDIAIASKMADVRAKQQTNIVALNPAATNPWPAA